MLEPRVTPGAVTEEAKADEWARRDMDMKLSAKELPIV